MITGIDISGNNGHFKTDKDAFRKVRLAGHSFVYIKATEGQGYTFARYPQWRDLARTSKLLVGAYHFAQPGTETDDAKREAAHFAKSINLHRGDSCLPPALDFEVNKANLTTPQLVTWGIDFLREFELRTGHVALFYTYTSFWKYTLKKTTAFDKSLLWQAQYTSGLAPASLGRPWTFWQHTNALAIAGLAGRYDGNRFNGTLGQLQDLEASA